MRPVMKEEVLGTGCGEGAADQVERLWQSGQLADALHEMRVIRCDLMEELHRSQRRVDRLDYLIRQTEKEIHGTRERKG